MANKKKIATSVAAVAMAAAMLLGGTFAWQSISQTALNEASDIVNPGGRLHDDFDGENKDVYVENFADEPIYARVRLGEYMEIVVNKGMGDPIEKTVAVIGGKTEEDGVEKYNYRTFMNYATLTEDGALTAGVDENDPDKSWWTWTTGGSTVYMPTFNLNKDSLEADVNGTLQGLDGVVTDAEDDDRYSDYVTYEVGETKIADEIYDADTNDVEDENVTKVEATHTATATDVAKLISMEEWMGKVVYDDNGEPANIDDLENYWVYDEDGWVYYSKAIEPHTATGLLLSGIELNEVMDDSWYYAIQVTGQFITADDMGSVEDSTGFYDPEKGAPPTENALKLLEHIGVEVPEDGTTGDEGGEVEPKGAMYSGGEVCGETLALCKTANYFGSDGYGIDFSVADLTTGWTVKEDVTYSLSGEGVSGTYEDGFYYVKSTTPTAELTGNDSFTFTVTMTWGEETYSCDVTVYIVEQNLSMISEYDQSTFASGSGITATITGDHVDSTGEPMYFNLVGSKIKVNGIEYEPSSRVYAVSNYTGVEYSYANGVYGMSQSGVMVMELNETTGYLCVNPCYNSYSVDLAVRSNIDLDGDGTEETVESIITLKVNLV